MKRSIQTFLWRGGLGGAVGGCLWVWLLPGFEHQDAYTQYARVLVMLYVAPFSTVIGMIVAWIVVRLHAKTKKNDGLPARVAIGVVCSAAAALVIWASVNAIRIDEQPFVWSTKYWLLFGVIVGVLAGATVGEQNTSR